MGSRRHLAALRPGRCWSPGCSPGAATGRPERRQGREPRPGGLEAAPRIPHFEGRLPVLLEAGNQVFVPPPCKPDPARGRRCSLDGETTYLGYPDSEVDATLVDASVAPNDNRTSWVVTLTFDDAAGPRRIGATAVARAGMLLLVDDQDRVLLTHRPVTVPQRSIIHGRVTLDPMDKAHRLGPGGVVCGPGLTRAELTGDPGHTRLIDPICGQLGRG